MKKTIWICALILCFCLSFGAVKEIVFTAKDLTQLPSIYWCYLYDLVEKVGDEFDANWDSLRIYTAEEEIPYQYVDTDGNGKLSANDQILFAFDGKAKMVISDDPTINPVEYPAAFEYEQKESSIVVTLRALPTVLEVDKNGLTTYKKQGTTEGTLFAELGIARVAGWKGSTFWVDGQLGTHEEKTTPNFQVLRQSIAGNGAISFTVVTVLESMDFVGMEQHIVTHILFTGEVLVENTFVFRSYVDLMKLQVMATRPLTDVDRETLKHVLPLFRKMLWAEQTSSSPWEYWKERGALKIFQDKPYIVFPAADSMKPLWWGAAYIFVSEEPWRGNYSEKLGLGAMEMDPIMKPIVWADLEKFLLGNTWVYESNELRSGIFRWFPGELEASFVTLPAGLDDTYGAFLSPDFSGTTAGDVSKKLEDWPIHFVAGDEVYIPKLYGIYSFPTVTDLITFTENRAQEVQSSAVVQ